MMVVIMQGTQVVKVAVSYARWLQHRVKRSTCMWVVKEIIIVRALRVVAMAHIAAVAFRPYKLRRVL